MAGACLAGIAASAAWAAPGQNVTGSSDFATSSTNQYLSRSTFLDVSIVDRVEKDSVGGISCAGACAGAYLSWAIGANFSAFANASINNSVQSAYQGVVKTTVGSAQPGPVRVGDTFLLLNEDKITDGLQLFGKGQITANVGATLFAGGELLGDVCVGICLNPNANDRIISLGTGSSQTINIFSYDSAANNVTFMGNSFNGVLPKDFQADNLPISAHVAPVDLSGATGFGGTFTTKQEIGGVYMDVAQVVANAFGIPNEALAGSFIGFDYVTISAKLGMAIDLVQEVTTTVQTVTKYLFSQPVEFQRLGEAGYSNPTTSFLLSQGEAALVRAGDASSLTFLTDTSVFSTVETSLTLNAVIKAPIKILEITGNGLDDVGPLFQANLA
jgi:hypothetical protein